MKEKQRASGTGGNAGYVMQEAQDKRTVINLWPNSKSRFEEHQAILCWSSTSRNGHSSQEQECGGELQIQPQRLHPPVLVGWGQACVQAP